MKESFALFASLIYAAALILSLQIMKYRYHSRVLLALLMLTIHIYFLDLCHELHALVSLLLCHIGNCLWKIRHPNHLYSICLQFSARSLQRRISVSMSQAFPQTIHYFIPILLFVYQFYVETMLLVIFTSSSRSKRLPSAHHIYQSEGIVRFLQVVLEYSIISPYLLQPIMRYWRTSLWSE